MAFTKVIWDTLANFGDQTSIAGLNNAAHRKSYAKKVYWLLIFAVGSYFTIIGFIGTINDYNEFNVVTSTDLTHMPSVIFPAVSICNHNKVHCVNLFEEQVAFQDKLEAAESASQQNASLIAYLNRTHSALRELVQLSGCGSQICDFLHDSLPDNGVDLTNQTFGYLALRREVLSCSGGKFDRECYFWVVLSEKAVLPGLYDRELMEAAVVDLQCNTTRKTAVCNYKVQSKVGFLSPRPYPKMCPPPANAPGPPAGRKKRQAPFPPGPGSPSLPAAPANPPPVNVDFEQASIFLKKFMDLDSEVRMNIGHRIGNRTVPTLNVTVHSLIAACTYKGGTCTGQEYWYPFATAEFGNCYSFNSAYNLEDKYNNRKTTLTGASNGLSVEIFLDQSFYMINKLSKKAGARIVIHDPSSPPLPDEYGLDVRPNTATSVSIQKTDITRKEYPYKSNCTAGWNNTGYSIATDLRYTLATCQRYCLQKDIAEMCNCVHPNLVMARVNSTFGKPICLVTPKETNPDYTCLQNVTGMHDNFERNCTCNVACQEVDFSAIATTSTWPSNQYWFDMANDLGYGLTEEDRKGPLGTVAKTKIQEDYSRVDVYYQTLNVKVIVQNPVYSTDESVISSIGGVLGLYLGIAIIMAFEIVELMWDLIVNMFLYSTKT